MKFNTGRYFYAIFIKFINLHFVFEESEEAPADGASEKVGTSFP